MHSVGQANVIMLMIGLAFSVISKHIIIHQITFIATKLLRITLHLHCKERQEEEINEVSRYREREREKEGIVLKNALRLKICDDTSNVSNILP